MKILRLSLLSLALAIGFAAQAQTTNKEAKQLLKEASEKIQSQDVVYMDFHYNFENTKVDPPVTQEETGNIAIKGDDYHLVFMGIEQIRSGNTVYTILKEDEEVQVTEYDEEEEDQGLTPSSIFTLYQKDHSYKLGQSKKMDGRSIQYVILKPVASEEVKEIKVGIEKESKQIVSLEQTGTNGTITTFKITNYVPGKELPSGYFSFNKNNYPGYYIAD